MHAYKRVAIRLRFVSIYSSAWLTISTQSCKNLISELATMDSNPLRQEVAKIRQSLFDEKLLDEQFVQMEQLEDVDNPNFAEEVMTLYLRDSAKLLATVEQALEKPPDDLTKLDKCLHQLKGSSASVGANKVWRETAQMREYLKAGDMERTMIQFQQVKRVHETLRGRMVPYFHLLRQAGPAETAQPPK